MVAVWATVAHAVLAGRASTRIICLVPPIPHPVTIPSWTTSPEVDTAA